jgi:hypothetical protein
LTSSASAGEVTNIFSSKDPKIEEQSRAASAAALQGVQSIIVALEHSELRQLDDRKQSLLSASKILDDAILKMKAIPIEDNVNVQLLWEKIPENDRQFVLYLRTSYLGEKELPKNVRDVYNDMISITTGLSESVKKATTTNDPILPRDIVGSTARFLYFGSVISEVIAVSAN